MSMAMLLAAWVIAQAASAPRAAVDVGPRLSFDYKQHLAMDFECAACHAMAEPGAAMGCRRHRRAWRVTTMSNRPSDSDDRGVPDARTACRMDARLSRAFVVFRHKPHVRTAAVACEACHGAVREMATMIKRQRHLHGQLHDCHKERDAPTGCDICHEPL